MNTFATKTLNSQLTRCQILLENGGYCRLQKKIRYRAGHPFLFHSIFVAVIAIALYK